MDLEKILVVILCAAGMYLTFTSDEFRSMPVTPLGVIFSIGIIIFVLVAAVIIAELIQRIINRWKS